MAVATAALLRGAPSQAAAPPTANASSEPSRAAVPKTSTRRASPGAGRALRRYVPVNGTLEPDPEAPAGPPRPDELRAELTAGHAVTVVASQDHEGEPAEPVGDLAVELRRGGVVVARDDEGAGSGERELVYTPPRGGRYVVRVSAPTARRATVRYSVVMYPAVLGPRSARAR
jgi:hypothetical protein